MQNLTPKQQYLKDINDNGFAEDEAQWRAVEMLDRLFQDIIHYQNQPRAELPTWQKWLGKKAEQPKPPQGVYFWGGVGRGKTYLMDTFYEALPTSRKSRMHFHRFMHRVHDELTELGNVENPLEKVADRFKAEVDIICFDEFFVSDITDAMILGTLMQALFARNIVLVATSNIPPDDLYRNGLQRARFLPAIELINQNCQILNVDSGIDYRLRTLQQAEIYHFPLDQQAGENLEKYYQQLIGHHDYTAQKVIEVNHRLLEVVNAHDDVLYASFAQLCETARSQNDYIELSKVYHTVLLACVPQMGATKDDAARRFIALVDEFYERKVKLIISAEVAMDELYTEGQLSFEFKRCQSRLTEMQSHEYLALAHLA
ncbi:cell division protein ZapE [Vibrio sp. SCSIO 43136]|uniref:cell division protein ZapE n=1 Tax=Vibrio sp. SCSIO 43136 TaxID=2819101 RepID=UPI002075F93C|nr:cell division protein ZapE [Vibrio sp. SCSIO 43136]USD64894.1 AFG1 family ATPase [Vibrio sp. SCSIO 43136]